MARVLVVDDSWVARLGMGRLLTSLGHEVLEAENGTQALDRIGGSAFDAVFLDLLMPGLDGFGVLEALGPRLADLPVFILSADIQATTLQKCRDLGARDCLTKPPTREQVASALRTLG